MLRRITKTLFFLFHSISDMQLKGKSLMRIRGYLNYYLSFAGFYFSLVNRILLLKNKRPFLKIILFIIKKDFIKFCDYNQFNNDVHIFSDATSFKIAAVDIINSVSLSVTSFRPIMINELKAATLFIKLAKKLNKTNLNLYLYIDNKAVVAFVNRGRYKWTKDFAIRTHFFFLSFFNEARKWFFAGKGRC